MVVEISRKVLIDTSVSSSSCFVECESYVNVSFLQVRAKLSTFGGFGGPTEVTCGGNALKFYASMRLNIRRIGLVKKGEEVSIQNLLTDFEFQALTFT